MTETRQNLFSGIPEMLPRELFETLLINPHWKLERILSRGQSTPEGQWLAQPESEWVLLLRGKAAIRFEDSGRLTELEPGDCLLIPGACRHRVEWTSSEETAVWLAFHFEAAAEEGASHE